MIEASPFSWLCKKDPILTLFKKILTFFIFEGKTTKKPTTRHNFGARQNIGANCSRHSTRAKTATSGV
jgi:hypothetical protein